MFVSLILVLALSTNGVAAAKQMRITDFSGHVPFHINHHSTTGPVGLTPSISQPTITKGGGMTPA